MANLIYKLWTSDGIINEWQDKTIALEETREYLDNNPEDINFLHFGALRLGSKNRAAAPVFSVHGSELMDYLNDSENEGSTDEWQDYSE